MHLEVKVVCEGFRLINADTGEELVVTHGVAVVLGRVCYVTEEDYSAIRNSKQVVRVKDEH